MAQISPKYASPGLRLGLLLHDHPNATYEFSLKTGKELGIPEQFGGGGNFCEAVIHFGDGKADAVAWKPVPNKGDADQWNVLCTKTLGRALKKAGYPDDTDDLKALVLWRQRDAEVKAIQAGTQQLAIQATSAPAAPQQALGAGAPAPARQPDALEQAFDDAASTTPDDEDVVDAEMVDDDDLALLDELISGLEGRHKANFKAYLKTIGAPESTADFTPSQIQDVLAWLEPGD